MKVSQLLGSECWRSSWQRKRQRCFKGFSTSKLCAVNQRRRLSPGDRAFLQPEEGGLPQGKRTQPNRCRELQVSVSLYERASIHSHTVDSCDCAWVCCIEVYLRVCPCACVCLFGKFAKQPAPEGGEFCLHIDEQATLLLCPWALHKHYNHLRARPFHNIWCSWTLKTAQRDSPSTRNHHPKRKGSGQKSTVWASVPIPTVKTHQSKHRWSMQS